MAWEGYVMGFESRVEEIETRDAPIVQLSTPSYITLATGEKS